MDFIDRRWSETFKVSLKIKLILSKTAFFSSVDIDDIFVGDSGTRLGKSDVSAMIDFTNKLGSLWFPSHYVLLDTLFIVKLELNFESIKSGIRQLKIFTWSLAFHQSTCIAATIQKMRVKTI